MMTKCMIFSILIWLLVCNVLADTKCNLRAIFKTPKQSDYDEFELKERSNFGEEPKIKGSEINLPNTFSNARVLLRLGDYKNAVKRNNHNVNTRITLAGPNHNNYYQPPFIHPYYQPFVPPMGYPLNLFYPNSRIPQIYPQYYVVSHPRYSPQNPLVPSSVRYVSPVEISPKQPIRKPKIIINTPIVLDNSVIQHIPVTSSQPKSSASNGLNTMTVIPKILIDTVAKQPSIVKKLETEKLIADPQINIENRTVSETPSVDPKLENSDKPQVEDLRVDGIETHTQNLTNEEPLAIEISPEQIQNLPKEDINTENLQIVEFAPAIFENAAPNENSNLSDIEDSNTTPSKNESDAVDGQETSSKDSTSIEPLNLESPSTDNPIHNMDHPRVLHPVKLSNNIENVEIVGAGTVNISLTTNSPSKVESCTNTKDFELVNLLKKSLVPFINLKTNGDPKLLVSYPIINNSDMTVPGHPSAIIVESMKKEPTFCAACVDSRKPRNKNVDIDNLNIFKIASTPEVYSNVYESSNGYSLSTLNSPTINGVPKIVVSGYKMSSASGQYEDPTQKIVYKKPTEITVVPPQITEDIPRFVEPTYVYTQPFYPNWEPFVYTSANRRYLKPRQELRTMQNSNIFDFMKYLLGDVSVPSSPFSRPSNLCPTCAKPMIIPTIIRCPHCMNYHDVSRGFSAPDTYQSFCPDCMESTHVDQHVLKPLRLLRKCPYCAKYRGELNQLEA